MNWKSTHPNFPKQTFEGMTRKQILDSMQSVFFDRAKAIFDREHGKYKPGYVRALAYHMRKEYDDYLEIDGCIPAPILKSVLKAVKTTPSQKELRESLPLELSKRQRSHIADLMPIIQEPLDLLYVLGRTESEKSFLTRLQC